MKKLLILLFSILISFNSYGEWKKYWEGGGDSAYVDISSIKQNNEYVYYWRMTDNAKPDKWGDMSSQIYNQGHCNINRIKTLSYVYFKKGMGRGPSEHEEPYNKDWKYPNPNSYALAALNYVCDYVK